MPGRPSPVSFLARLRSDLEVVVSKVEGLTLASPTVSGRLSYPANFMPMNVAEHMFGELPPQGRQLQVEARGAYLRWFDRFELVLTQLPTHEADRLRRVSRNFVAIWLDRSEQRVSIPRPAKRAVEKFRAENISEFEKCLRDLDRPDGRVLLFPDTNALVRTLDLHLYGAAGGFDKFEVVIPATVLKELEEHTHRHPRPEFREKVKGVLRRIKGWRAQGDIRDGVLVHGVKVRLRAEEPTFKNTLSHLDKDNPDDRIVATALELQGSALSSIVVLVTADVNLQTKADAAGLPFIEPPPQPDGS